MSIGNNNTNGSKKSNCNWQLRIVQAVTRCCSTPSGPTGPPVLTEILGQAVGVCEQQIAYHAQPEDASITSFTWTLPTGATIIGATNVDLITIEFDLSFEPVGSSISVYATNAFGNSNTVSLEITSCPSDITSITGLTVVGDSEPGLTYSCPASTGAASYTWTVPGDAFIVAGQGTTSIIVDWGSTSGDVSVYSSNNCCDSVEYSISVTVA